jgi:catechol 2,3-dioxygenase-like lactoylglutathione lyase family enzyme
LRAVDREPLSVLHLNLLVADLDRSVAFYEHCFGFHPHATYGDGTVFVRNAQGFDLGLKPGAPGAMPAPTMHFGFRATDPDAVRSMRDELHRMGAPFTEESDEDDFVGCKVLDPDGYEIEIYWEA